MLLFLAVKTQVDMEGKMFAVLGQPACAVDGTSLCRARGRNKRTISATIAVVVYMVNDATYMFASHRTDIFPSIVVVGHNRGRQIRP